MQHQPLLDELRELEVSLHRPEVRADPVRLSALLHEDFWEIGRSGDVWSRQATLNEFAGQPQTYSVWAQDFRVEELAQGVALLTYRSAHQSLPRVLERHSRRASIWVRTTSGWKMRFHQGTPSEAFDARES